MDKDQVVNVGRRVLVFIGQLIALIVCMGFIEFQYYQNILPDKEVRDTYPQTICTLTKKQLSHRGHIVDHYRADFLLMYSVNNQAYQTWVTGNGLDRAYTTNKDSQDTILDQFDVGQNYPCWYNPDHPQLAVLVMRHNWTSTFPLLIPTVIAVIVLYYLAQSIFIFFGWLTLRRQISKKKDKK